MTWIILTIITVILGVVFWAVVRAMNKSDVAKREAYQRELEAQDERTNAGRYGATPQRPEYWGNPKYLGHIVLGILLVLWLFVTFLFSFHFVGSGDVGIVRSFGVISGQRGSGFAPILPWQSLSTQNIKTQKYVFDNEGCDAHNACSKQDQIVAFSSDTQEVFINASLNFALSEAEVTHLLKTVGTNWFDVLVKSRVQNFAKEATIKYTSVDEAPHREDLRLAIQQRLVSELQPYSITVSAFLIDNLDFDQGFKQSIEDKQVSAQKAIQATNDATALVNAAEGKKQATIKGADADAYSITAKADAQAAANTKIAASLTPDLVQYQLALAQSGWPVTTYVPGNSPVIVGK